MSRRKKQSGDSPSATRAIRLPIRAIVDPNGADLFTTFRRAWQMSTALANWAQLELAFRDVRRGPLDGPTMPAYDRKAVFGEVPARFNRKASATKPAVKAGDTVTSDLYRLWNAEYPHRQLWDGMTTSAGDILQAVERTWTGHKTLGRYAVMWKGRASAATYKGGYPFPVRRGDPERPNLRLSRDEDGRPLASFVVPADDDCGIVQSRITVRLADGNEFSPQMERFDFLCEHPERLGQAKVCQRWRCGKLVGVMLHIVGNFDVAEKRTGKTFRVFTGPDNLITAVEAKGKGDPFVYPGDELRGVIIAHDGWSERLATAMKHEKRWPSGKRRRVFDGPKVQAKRDICRNRLRTARQQIAVCLVNWVVRQGGGKVVYTDADKSFLPRFDWTGLRELVRCKCVEHGISFQHQGDEEDTAE